MMTVEVAMPHVCLLGDSIFDNASYVLGEPAVIDQLRQQLPAGWNATLAAVDGATISGVAGQLKRAPADATHHIISVGGNDALRVRHLLHGGASIVSVARQLQAAHDGFSAAYRSMLATVAATGRHAAVCSIYDSVPGLQEQERAALAVFNDIILRQTFAAGLPVIDLRVLCDQPSDYSDLSPIEPSAAGGLKIAGAIARLVTTHDFLSRRSSIFC